MVSNIYLLSMWFIMEGNGMNYMKTFLLRLKCCPTKCVEKHLCNDWLAGTWFFTIATFLGVCGGIYESGYAISRDNGLEIYIWVTG